MKTKNVAYLITLVAFLFIAVGASYAQEEKNIEKPVVKTNNAMSDSTVSDSTMKKDCKEMMEKCKDMMDNPEMKSKMKDMMKDGKMKDGMMKDKNKSNDEGGSESTHESHHKDDNKGDG